jgi:hypothetical protein
MPSSFVDSRINQNLEVATEYFKALVSDKTKDITGKKTNQSAGSIGFIPFNISFTMDGIGGIKIYNELSLDTSFLPPGYTNTTDFIITGINHKIQNGDWETDLNVTLIPRTSPITNIITSSLQIFGQVETAPLTPPATTTSTVNAPTGCNPITFTPNDTTQRTDNAIAIATAKSVFPTLSKEALAALLGHLKAESQLNPTAYTSGGGGCGAVGIAQWRGNRQNNLFALAASKNTPINNINIQLEFVKQELTTGGNYWNKVWEILNQPGKTLLQYGAVVHLSYGLGSNNPDKPRNPRKDSFEYKKLANVDNWKYVYVELNGSRPDYIPTRYQYMQEFLALL